jgi:hypothetical protein
VESILSLEGDLFLPLLGHRTNEYNQICDAKAWNEKITQILLLKSKFESYHDIPTVVVELQQNMAIFRSKIFQDLDNKEKFLSQCLRMCLSPEDVNDLVDNVVTCLGAYGELITVIVWLDLRRWATPEIQNEFISRLPWITRRLLIASWVPKYSKLVQENEYNVT